MVSTDQGEPEGALLASLGTLSWLSAAAFRWLAGASVLVVILGWSSSWGIT